MRTSEHGLEVARATAACLSDLLWGRIKLLPAGLFLDCSRGPTDVTWIKIGPTLEQRIADAQEGTRGMALLGVGP
jgi:hypothetical protein